MASNWLSILIPWRFRNRMARALLAWAGFTIILFSSIPARCDCIYYTTYQKLQEEAGLDFSKEGSMQTDLSKITKPPERDKSLLPDWKPIRPGVTAWHGDKDFAIRFGTVNGGDLADRLQKNESDARATAKVVASMGNAISDGSKIDYKNDDIKLEGKINAYKMTAEVGASSDIYSIKSRFETNNVIPGIYVGKTYCEYSTRTATTTVGLRLAF
jgi:hypothetical protein